MMAIDRSHRLKEAECACLLFIDGACRQTLETRLDSDVWPLPDIGVLANVRFAQILLKKSFCFTEHKF